MNDFGSVIVSFLESLIELDIFLYFVVSMALFGVVFLIKKIIFD